MILGDAKRDPSALSIPCQLQGVSINSQLFWALSSSRVASRTRVSASYGRIYAVPQHAVANAVLLIALEDCSSQASKQ